MNENEKWVTHDMTVAATLVYFGESIVDIQKNFQGNIEFTFKKSHNLEDLIKAFELDELNVSPRRFSVALKDIKKIIFSHKLNH
ncbi:MAG: DUF5659 domain-containing protein [Patescibacteria group bacterium]